MATKKKPTKAELRTLLSAIRKRHEGPDASFEAAAARAKAYVDDLNAEGFGSYLKKDQPLTTFLATWKALVTLERRPVSPAKIAAFEAKLGAPLPPSYAAFLREWGGARFYRSPAEEEGAFVYTPDESLAARARLKKANDKIFSNYAKRYPALAAQHGEARDSWEGAPLKSTGLFSVRDIAALNFLPVCPYYDGAFCLALHAPDSRGESRFFCVSPTGPEPQTFTLYGHSTLEWFSSMVTWSIAEVRPSI